MMRTCGSSGTAPRRRRSRSPRPLRRLRASDLLCLGLPAGGSLCLRRDVGLCSASSAAEPNLSFEGVAYRALYFDLTCIPPLRRAPPELRLPRRRIAVGIRPTPRPRRTRAGAPPARHRRAGERPPAATEHAHRHVGAGQAARLPLVLLGRGVRRIWHRSGDVADVALEEPGAGGGAPGDAGRVEVRAPVSHPFEGEGRALLPSSAGADPQRRVAGEPWRAGRGRAGRIGGGVAGGAGLRERLRRGAGAAGPAARVVAGSGQALTLAVDWPSGQLTRPWKWLTRQIRVEHWKDRDSMYTSEMSKPAKWATYSSSGVHGSPTPPPEQASGIRARAVTRVSPARADHGEQRMDKTPPLPARVWQPRLSRQWSPRPPATAHRIPGGVASGRRIFGWMNPATTPSEPMAMAVVLPPAGAAPTTAPGASATTKACPEATNAALSVSRAATRPRRRPRLPRPRCGAGETSEWRCRRGRCGIRRRPG